MLLQDENTRSVRLVESIRRYLFFEIGLDASGSARQLQDTVDSRWVLIAHVWML